MSVAALEYQFGCPNEVCSGIIHSSVVVPGAVIHCPQCHLEMKVAPEYKGPDLWPPISRL